ncbi:MAG: 7TM domain-containing protein [Desulfobacterales bacterium]|nr:7TM domain-containing protein [Desulfobacterales bacterium]
MSLIKERPGAVVAICTLVAVGVIGILLRTVWISRGGLQLRDKVWQLTLGFQFQSDRPGAVASIALPGDTTQVRVLGQTFFFPKMRQTRLRDTTSDLREAVFVAPYPGEFYLRADFQIYLLHTVKPPPKTKKTALSADSRELYLNGEPHIQIEDERVKSTFEMLFSSETEKNKLLELIADFSEKKIAGLAMGGPADAAGALLDRKATTLGRARAMVALCRIAKIPARLVSGFILDENPSALPHFWVEVFLDDQWLPVDPENGYRFDLPANFVPFRPGGSEIFQIKGGTGLTRAYSITHITEPHGFRGSERKNPMEIIDLTRLPVSVQSSLIILLMLPVGALITTFARNVIGIRAIGTFTPTLLALATVYADWRTATAIFIIVVVIGLGGRSLLPGLKLLKIPRLSLVFTLVTVSMTFTVSALEYIHFTPDGHVVLLPLVVLTTIVDRIYSVADRDGKRLALQRLCWTIVIALSCVWIFTWQIFGRLLLIYPEQHFITLALLLLLGLYNARKLSDLPYFHFLSEEHLKRVGTAKS